jgi:hypothetical protein
MRAACEPLIREGGRAGASRALTKVGKAGSLAAVAVDFQPWRLLVPHLLIRHKVKDFAKWKPGYDAHQPARQAAGLTETLLARNADNPNEVIILFAAKDLAQARAFAGSADLKAKMQEVGVVDQPDIYFLA